MGVTQPEQSSVHAHLGRWALPSCSQHPLPCWDWAEATSVHGICPRPAPCLLLTASCCQIAYSGARWLLQGVFTDFGTKTQR